MSKTDPLSKKSDQIWLTVPTTYGSFANLFICLFAHIVHLSTSNRCSSKTQKLINFCYVPSNKHMYCNFWTTRNKHQASIKLAVLMYLIWWDMTIGKVPRFPNKTTKRTNKRTNKQICRCEWGQHINISYHRRKPIPSEAKLRKLWVGGGDCFATFY